MTEACNIYRVFNPVRPRQRGRALKWDSAFDPAHCCKSLRSQPLDRGAGSWLESRRRRMNIHEHDGYHLRHLVRPLDLTTHWLIFGKKRQKQWKERCTQQANDQREPRRTSQQELVITAAVWRTDMDETAGVTVIKRVTKKETRDWPFLLGEASAFPPPKLWQG